jgi:hypothetical protein
MTTSEGGSSTATCAVESFEDDLYPIGIINQLGFDIEGRAELWRGEAEMVSLV